MAQLASARKPWIDALRALAMLFVMYGHMVQEQTAFFVFTSPIKIPLFFALTGYLFKDPEGGVKAFLGKLLRTLVVPWLFLSCLPVVAFSAVFGFNSLQSFLRSSPARAFGTCPAASWQRSSGSLCEDI